MLGRALATQAELHAPFGGVVPKLAADAHQRAIDGTVERALAMAGLRIGDVDAVAVTSGPGLSLCLRVGGGKAAALAREAGVPLVQVHHLEAHALVARLGGGGEGGRGGGEGAGEAGGGGAGEAGGEGAEGASSRPPAPPRSPPFPFVCVLASGGHNLLLLVRGVGDYAVLGTTLDDALGEAFDKVARMLGLDATPSGGAAVENAAAGRFPAPRSAAAAADAAPAAVPGDPMAFGFARPLRNRRGSANVSYAGLKTAVRMAAERTLPELLARAEAEAAAEEGEGPGGPPRGLEGPPPPPPSARSLLRKAQADLAASFQRVAVEHLAEKAALGLRQALEPAPAPGAPAGRVSALVLTGGVACNAVLRRELGRVAAGAGLPLVAPPPGLCTDNGVMVAWAAHERLDAGVARLPRPAGMPDPAPDGWVDCRPRWPLAAPTRAFVEELGGSARWMKSARLHESLTELTREVLLGQGRGGGAEGSEDGGGGGARWPPSPPPPPLEEVAL